MQNYTLYKGFFPLFTLSIENPVKYFENSVKIFLVFHGQVWLCFSPAPIHSSYPWWLYDARIPEEGVGGSLYVLATSLEIIRQMLMETEQSGQ